MDKQQAKDIIESLIGDIDTELTSNNGTVTGTMAETNAEMFSEDGYEINEADHDPKTDRISFQLSITLTGDQDPERPAGGDKIEIEMSGEAVRHGKVGWKLGVYTVESCTLNF